MSMIYFCQMQSIEIVTFAISNFKKQEVKKPTFLFHYGQMGRSRKRFKKRTNNVL